ncbi:hypothetical protein [uncultured Alistipes sp.]|jgi:hypothetical protein|uniref:hypothetical protein n=1 Tax=uncultured Alistipes sp. TaxID=538949 RepID=UPI0027D99B9C|nr:hypothetical protein [uncultured Alistipes sp.]
MKAQKNKKAYLIEIELDTIEVRVIATTAAEAKRKAVAKLNRKNASSYIRREFKTHRRAIDIIDSEKLF